MEDVDNSLEAYKNNEKNHLEFTDLNHEVCNYISWIFHS